MRIKRRIVLLFGMMMLVLVSWIVYGALQPQVLAVGALLPRVPCTVCQGTDTLRTTEAKMTLVMLFNTRCPHCLYELDLFDKNYAALTDLRIYLITTESGFQLCKDPLRWLNLCTTDQVIWAHMAEPDFSRHFGAAIAPSVFIFDTNGILKSKIRGEAKFEKILASCK